MQKKAPLRRLYAPMAQSPEQPETGSDANAVEGSNGQAPPRRRTHVLYPNYYTWFVLLSALDVMFTRVILSPTYRGRELNWVANYVLQRWDVTGLVIYKFLLAAFVVVICEYVGRRRHRTGLRLARWAVLIGCVPVAVQVYLFLTHLPHM